MFSFLNDHEKKVSEEHEKTVLTRAIQAILDFYTVDQTLEEEHTKYKTEQTGNITSSMFFLDVF